MKQQARFEKNFKNIYIYIYIYNKKFSGYDNFLYLFIITDLNEDSWFSLIGISERLDLNKDDLREFKF